MIREENVESGDLLQGTLEMLVLKALARGPLHGYGVAEWIHQTSQQLLKVEEGALYPALHRLELRGLLEVFVREVRRDPLAGARLPDADDLRLTDASLAARIHTVGPMTSLTYQLGGEIWTSRPGRSLKPPRLLLLFRRHLHLQIGSLRPIPRSH